MKKIWIGTVWEIAFRFVRGVLVAGLSLILQPLTILMIAMSYDRNAVGIIQNLAMLVRRLAHKHPNEKLKIQSLNYLRGESLAGDILRALAAPKRCSCVYGDRDPNCRKTNRERCLRNKFTPVKGMRVIKIRDSDYKKLKRLASDKWLAEEGKTLSLEEALSRVLSVHIS